MYVQSNWNKQMFIVGVPFELPTLLVLAMAAGAAANANALVAASAVRVRRWRIAVLLGSGDSVAKEVRVRGVPCPGTQGVVWATPLGQPAAARSEVASGAPPGPGFAAPA